jgi:hypothetical protein
MPKRVQTASRDFQNYPQSRSSEIVYAFEAIVEWPWLAETAAISCRQRIKRRALAHLTASIFLTGPHWVVLTTSPWLKGIKLDAADLQTADS